jgi:hypothetical protein
VEFETLLGACFLFGPIQVPAELVVLALEVVIADLPQAFLLDADSLEGPLRHHFAIEAVVAVGMGVAGVVVFQALAHILLALVGPTLEVLFAVSPRQ